MADIELVIKLSKKNCEHIKRLGALWIESEKGLQIVSKALLDGIILPKGHGDLIDRNDLLADSYCIDDWSGNEVNIVDVETIKMADAIIKADNAESEEV